MEIRVLGADYSILGDRYFLMGGQSDPFRVDWMLCPGVRKKYCRLSSRENARESGKDRGDMLNLWMKSVPRREGVRRRSMPGRCTRVP